MRGSQFSMSIAFFIIILGKVNGIQSVNFIRLFRYDASLLQFSSFRQLQDEDDLRFSLFTCSYLSFKSQNIRVISARKFKYIWRLFLYAGARQRDKSSFFRIQVW